MNLKDDLRIQKRHFSSTPGIMPGVFSMFRIQKEIIDF